MTTETRNTKMTRPRVCPAIQRITTMPAAEPMMAHGGMLAGRPVMGFMLSPRPAMTRHRRWLV